MTAAQSGIVGSVPGVLIQPIPYREPNPEIAKYEKLWQMPEYREVAPGEQVASVFLEIAKPPRDAECLDFGCGTGRGALMLALLGGLRVKMLDFTTNCLDPEVAEACVTQPTRISFAQRDLSKKVPDVAAYGYCCDVMEHIPTADVPKTLHNILHAAHHVFFCISTVDDVMGAKIGEKLHLTVQPLAWWLDQVKAAGGVVHWSREVDGACFVYCSSWQDAGELVKTGVINVSDEQLDANVKANLEAGWAQVVPHQKQDREVVLLAGGPSMKGQLDKIRELRAEGCAIVTVNGAYHWALENELPVGAQVVLDARAFNARFTRPVRADVKYLIASQADPSTLEGLPEETTSIWHSGISDANEALARSKLDGFFFPVPGGSTVTLRAIPLLRMLGFARIHVFGWDSCVMGDEHHAYGQAENDGQPTVPITCGGRTFWCVPWHVSQASEFRDLIKFLGDEIELAVYGDGLISHMLQTGASIPG
jgi:SAM-dependent methyltransferase